MSLRIGFGRLAQESNAFSPVPSTVADFRRTHWMEGEELLQACGSSGHEAPDFTKNAELSGFVSAVRRARDVEPVPLLSAWAVPGGPLAAESWTELRDRMLASIAAAGPLDGLFLVLHGALCAEGCEDPEGELLAAVRRQVGPDVKIAVVFDLHGQMTRLKVESVDLLTAYRTNPHRDHAKVGARTGRLLLRAVRGQIRPRIAWRSLPLLLAGGTTIDFLPTMRPLYRRMRRMERDPRVLYTSLFNCHVWNDHPDLGWSAVVVTDDAPDLGEELAEELAERAWAVKDVTPPEFPTAEEAVRQARSARLARFFGTVCMCDASDIVGAGAPGESTALLRVLHEQADDLLSYVPLRDAVTVDQLWDRPQDSVSEVTVGGRLRPDMSPPLPLTARMVSRHDSVAFGRRVVVSSRGVRLVLTEEAPLAMKPSFFKQVGLRPWAADVVVVKSLFPFRWYFLGPNRKSVGRGSGTVASGARFAA